MPINPNQFTEVTKIGYGQRIISSIKGIVFGFGLFFGSFVLLFWNEGRLDVSTVAQNAVEASADEVQAELDGEFVWVSGTLSTEETLGGDLGYLQPGDYIALSRSVEMYAWVETSSTESDTNLGGSETQTTTYDYHMEWTSMPQNSTGFKIQDGHHNPQMTYENWNGTVDTATVGVYNVDPAELALPANSSLVLSEEMVVLPGYEELHGNYVYVPIGYEGTFANPEVGDMRITYSVLEDEVDGTVFAELDGAELVPFVDLENDNTKLYRFLEGGRDEAIATMHTEYTMTIWLFRILGFFMMYIGLNALFAPLSVVLDVLPFLGSVSRGLVSIVTFIVSLVLTLVTIVVSMIVHNVWAMIAIGVLTLAGIAYLVKQKAESKGLTGKAGSGPGSKAKK